MLRYSILAEARHGFRNNQFFLMFEPRLSLTDKIAVGFEAVLYWQHPRIGLLAPPQFLDDLETSALSAQLARFMLTESVQRVAEWRSRGLGALVVTIGMPGAEIVREGFASQVEHILKWYEVEPRSLEIAMTDRTDFSVFPTLEADLLPLQQLGVRLALDHFGTGFASLNVFRRFAFDTVKLDRSCLSGAPEDPVARHVVESVVALCDGVERIAVIDGVEREAQLEWLGALQNALVQGPLISAPVPANEIDDFISRTNGIELAT
jgi:diguanylate cyclase